MAIAPSLPASKNAKFEAGRCVQSKSLDQARYQGLALFHLWHLSSLDAPTVAIAWCVAFGWVANVHLPWWLPTILGLSAWSFYVTDRLLDARRGVPLEAQNSRAEFKPTDLRPRHRFHWKHRKYFLPAAIVAGALALALVWRYMPLAAQTRNSVLAFSSIAYLTSVHASKRRLNLRKELLVALVFTTACTLPTLTRASQPALLLAPVCLFIALAWLNCQAIETWESDPEARVPVALAACGLAVVAAVTAGVELRFHQPRPAALALSAAISAALIACLDNRRERLTPTTLRAAADFVLLAPIVLLAWQW